MKYLDPKEGTVGLSLKWVDGRLRVVTDKGEPVSGVLSFDVSAEPESAVTISIQAIMSVPRPPE